MYLLNRLFRHLSLSVSPALPITNQVFAFLMINFQAMGDNLGLIVISRK